MYNDENKIKCCIDICKMTIILKKK